MIDSEYANEIMANIQDADAAIAVFTDQASVFVLEHLRDGNIDLWVLKELKSQLTQFNAHTGEWK